METFEIDAQILEAFHMFKEYSEGLVREWYDVSCGMISLNRLKDTLVCLNSFVFQYSEVSIGNTVDFHIPVCRIM